MAGSAYQAIFPGVNQGKDVYFQGSRQMDNFSRRYYERELGAGIAPSPSMREHFGYTEPSVASYSERTSLPRPTPCATRCPPGLPGADYLTNFHIGDPYTKIDEGYARLPGAGYEALHPELKGVDPRDYPDINKLAILADVAPYSREYNIFRQKVGNDSQDNTELRIEYEKILDRVRQTRESVIRMDNQVFPSCRTQNTSRARAGKADPAHPPQLSPPSPCSSLARSMLPEFDTRSFSYAHP
jgi:hypothetical protein